MTTVPPSAKREVQWNDLRRLHAERREAIAERLSEFNRIPPSKYFYEIAYCLLTPQTSAENAGQVIEHLERVSFHLNEVDPEPFLSHRATYIRFHRTKANHLLRLKEEFPSIARALAASSSAFELREWLVKNVQGLGYKEATHFLRNVGRNEGLAILDRHILRNLQRFGAVRSVPKSLSRKKYLTVERAFIRFSERIGIPLDELDLLFWSMETGVIRK